MIIIIDDDDNSNSARTATSSWESNPVTNWKFRLGYLCIEIRKMEYSGHSILRKGSSCDFMNEKIED